MTVILDTEAPDDEAGRKLLAWWLRLLSGGHDKFIALDVKEGDVRDEKGVAVGHWKIDEEVNHPPHCEDTHCELPKGHTGGHKMGLYVRIP